MAKMTTEPASFREACDFVDEHHRHHVAPQGWKFGLKAIKNDKVLGVATVGRPVSRHLDDGRTLEITRVATDGSKNSSSCLLSACVRQANQLGYTRVITYTLASEPGVSLRACGFRVMHRSPGGSWNSTGRERVDKHPTGKKICWVHDRTQLNLAQTFRILDAGKVILDDDILDAFVCGEHCELFSYAVLVEDDAGPVAFQGDCGCIAPFPAWYGDHTLDRGPGYVQRFEAFTQCVIEHYDDVDYMTRMEAALALLQGDIRFTA